MKTFGAIATAIGLICSPSGAFMDVDPAALTRLTSAQLREAYLECEAASSKYRISTETMAYCNLLADVLLQRDFGGDWDRQLAWWKQAHRLRVELFSDP